MADPSDTPITFPHLSEQGILVYQLALRKGNLTQQLVSQEFELDATQAAEAVSVLLDLHLLRPKEEPQADGSDRVFLPVPPAVAAAGRVAPVEAELRRRLAEAERARAQLSVLEEVYAAGSRQSGTSGFDEILDLPTVLDLIEWLTTTCRTEVLTAQPGGPRAPHLLEQAFARDLAMIRRGVRMHTLYQHTARRHAPTQEYVERVTAAGAEVRTLTELFGRILVFDREVAVLPHRVSIDGAMVVREPSLVAYLCEVFDRAWSSAEAYTPLRQWDYVLDDVKHAVIRLLAEGMKDEMIARRLGMSLRTCRKHVAELMEALGASSRFQAGYLARTRLDVNASVAVAPKPSTAVARPEGDPA
ncbi:helix-turn-helix domain-containing protein [Streptomyces montanisoli]|uniref:Helix-turn-helix transcriptional regulator n=1 Tax=Streptomyces montanisoli TaxID=2798581 RepID=A0A940MHL3_9ACTN|nr:helix-turn-helix transcriptional regulator [Streptomyces montanisoli]MBP0458733.1 helix-turn-helix transcriptional regulator [Streptomyces montanisoli]